MKKWGNRGLSLLLSLFMLMGIACADQIYVLAEDVTPGAEVELARGKPATATHFQEGNGVASYAFDGDFSTKWSTYGYNNVVPVALQVDLGIQADISRLGMSWYGSGRIFNFEVYITDQAIVAGETAATEGLAPVVTGQGKGTAKQAEACDYIPLETAASGRYVTVVVTALEGTAAFVALAELEVWGMEALPTDLTQLIDNNTVTASFSQDICPVENAVDGDIATRWSAYGSQFPQAVMIDMDAVVSIGYLKLLIFQKGRITDFDIYLTNEPLVVGEEIDLGDAQPIGRIRGEGVGDGKTVPEDWEGAVICRTDFNATGRYLTLMGVTATSGTAAGLWEVEAYGEIKGPIGREILSVNALSPLTAQVNESGVEERFPQTVRVELEDERSALLPVQWDLESVRFDVPGDYTIQGVLDCTDREDILNSAGVTAQITVHIVDRRQEAIGAVEDLIAAIETVTQENYKEKLEPIQAAEQALADLLSEYGKDIESEVSNRDALQTARNRYDELVKQNAIVYGDLNADTEIDASDALLVLQHSVQLIALNDTQKIAGDVDGNANIDAADALLILQKSVKLISRFPVETK